jgi:hypothetical protein
MIIKEKAVTLIELMMVISMFMLFLLAFYATMEVGLKSWKIGEVRSDIQTSGETVMKRITGELQNADSIALNVYTPSDPNEPNAYICFETPVYEGKIQCEPNSGDPLWQGYVIYYTLNDSTDDSFNTKILYRRYIPHNTSSPYKSTGRTAASLLSGITDKLAVSLTVSEQEEGQEIKRICKRIIYSKFQQSGSIINIELGFVENIRKSKNARVAFAPGGNNAVNSGTERFVIKNSVNPKN